MKPVFGKKLKTTMTPPTTTFMTLWKGDTTMRADASGDASALSEHLRIQRAYASSYGRAERLSLVHIHGVCERERERERVCVCVRER
jgi:hypothetical protein